MDGYCRRDWFAMDLRGFAPLFLFDQHGRMSCRKLRSWRISASGHSSENELRFADVRIESAVVGSFLLGALMTLSGKGQPDLVARSRIQHKIIERFQDYSRVRFQARAGRDCSGWRNNDPTERAGSNPFAARILLSIRTETFDAVNDLAARWKQYDVNGSRRDRDPAHERCQRHWRRHCGLS
jgi:hypothetical protein